MTCWPGAARQSATSILEPGSHMRTTRPCATIHIPLPMLAFVPTVARTFSKRVPDLYWLHMVVHFIISDIRPPLLTTLLPPIVAPTWSYSIQYFYYSTMTMRCILAPISLFCIYSRHGDVLIVMITIRKKRRNVSELAIRPGVGRLVSRTGPAGGVGNPFATPWWLCGYLFLCIHMLISCMDLHDVIEPIIPLGSGAVWQWALLAALLAICRCSRLFSAAQIGPFPATTTLHTLLPCLIPQVLPLLGFPFDPMKESDKQYVASPNSRGTLPCLVLFVSL